jgi:tetratricopeptide (TPR) repeat protein
VNANPSFAESRRAIFLAGAAITLAGLIAYHNSFAGVFISDDRLSILGNPTIRHLWPLAAPLSPPRGWTTVSGRPFLNLSFAVNYAISGANPWSYHALNLLIHLLAGLTLFGIVRRTLEKVGTGGPPVRAAAYAKAEMDGGAARPYLLAFAAALLWTVHPLQTESVTYVVQRAESLMGLFYLLTLYCFIRWAGAVSAFARPGRASMDEEAGGRPWAWLSVVCCLLGMLTKEVMVTAPAIVLLYDRTFLTGSFGEALRRRLGFYAALFATWLPLAYLVLANGGNRGGSIGLGAKVDAGAYLLAQLPVAVHYLRLCVWPHPLVFDYGLQYLGNGPAAARAAIVLLPLLAATALALWKRPGLGFLGICFFGILAPSTLMPGTRQSLAEHRLYLPLAAVLVFGVLAVAKLGARGWPRLDRRAALVFCLAPALAYGALTMRRNTDYRSPMSLWSDTAAKQPDNGYAQSVLAALLIDDHRTAEGISRYETAVGLLPANAELHYDLANALVEGGREDEALRQYAQAIQLKPDFADAQCNWALALAKSGRPAEAIAHFAEAIRLNPDYPDAQYFLGNTLRRVHRLPEAIAHYREALRLQPDFADVESNLGVALYQTGQLAEAREAFEQAVSLKPDSSEFRYNLNLVQHAMQSPP